MGETLNIGLDDCTNLLRLITCKTVRSSRYNTGDLRKQRPATASAKVAVDGIGGPANRGNAVGLSRQAAVWSSDSVDGMRDDLRLGLT
jgi:hypothetical protein